MNIQKHDFSHKRIKYLPRKIFDRKYDLISLMVIFSLTHYLFTFGAFGTMQAATDISNAKTSCQNERGGGYQLYFETDKNVYYSGKRFSACESLIKSFSGEKVVITHGRNGRIGLIEINGKRLYQPSPYLFTFSYTFLFYMIYLFVKNRIKGAEPLDY